jgi:hypothetical protein
MPPNVSRPEEGDYCAIMGSIEHGECVPFLGAGANLCGHSAADWNPDQQTMLPLGSQLAAWLAKQFNYPLGTSSVTCLCHQTLR